MHKLTFKAILASGSVLAVAAILAVAILTDNQGALSAERFTDGQTSAGTEEVIPGIPNHLFNLHGALVTRVDGQPSLDEDSARLMIEDFHMGKVVDLYLVRVEILTDLPNGVGVARVNPVAQPEIDNKVLWAAVMDRLTPGMSPDDLDEGFVPYSIVLANADSGEFAWAIGGTYRP